MAADDPLGIAAIATWLERVTEPGRRIPPLSWIAAGLTFLAGRWWGRALAVGGWLVAAGLMVWCAK